MEWLMRLNRAIQYIEGKLTSEVSVNAAAREAAWFTAVSGKTKRRQS